jgi:UDP-N-acetylglucosamine pyrophosphorylase
MRMLGAADVCYNSSVHWLIFKSDVNKLQSMLFFCEVFFFVDKPNTIKVVLNTSIVNVSTASICFTLRYPSSQSLRISKCH